MIRRRLEIEHDPDPDFSWLEQDHYNPSHPSYDPVYRTEADMKAKRNPLDGNWYRNPENHVALAMVLYEMGPTDDDWRVADSLGGIDFLADEDNWTTGTFYHVRDIPEKATYLRDLARDMKLPR